jgi:hypothetical protein
MASDTLILPRKQAATLLIPKSESGCDTLRRNLKRAATLWFCAKKALRHFGNFAQCGCDTLK